MASTIAPLIPFEPPLITGVLELRYKRFLADVRLADGRLVTAHCPNPGAMTGYAAPGTEVWLSRRDNPKRKLKWTWEIAREGDDLVGVNPLLPNALVARGLGAEVFPTLTGYRSHRREVRFGESSRVDLLLEDHPTDPRPCYVEVKSATYDVGGVALFPDAVTARGLKHLRELRTMRQNGARAVMFFLINRTGSRAFAPAFDVDRDYAETLAAVVADGVEVVAWQTAVSAAGMGLARPLPVALTRPELQTLRETLPARR